MSGGDQTSGDGSDSLPMSTAESRAEHEAQRAKDYPLSDERLAPLRAVLAGRLRTAGVKVPDAEFDALVLDMARFALRWSAEEEEHRVDERRQGQRREDT